MGLAGEGYNAARRSAHRATPGAPFDRSVAVYMLRHADILPRSHPLQRRGRSPWSGLEGTEAPRAQPRRWLPRQHLAARRDSLPRKGLPSVDVYIKCVFYFVTCISGRPTAQWSGRLTGSCAESAPEEVIGRKRAPRASSLAEDPCAVELEMSQTECSFFLPNRLPKTGDPSHRHAQCRRNTKISTSRCLNTGVQFTFRNKPREAPQGRPSCGPRQTRGVCATPRRSMACASY